MGTLLKGVLSSPHFAKCGESTGLLLRVGSISTVCQAATDLKALRRLILSSGSACSGSPARSPVVMRRGAQDGVVPNQRELKVGTLAGILWQVPSLCPRIYFGAMRTNAFFRPCRDSAFCLHNPSAKSAGLFSGPKQFAKPLENQPARAMLFSCAPLSFEFLPFFSSSWLRLLSRWRPK